MTDAQTIKRLEHRVCELQTAVVAVIEHLAIEQRVAAVERARLEEIRLTGEPGGAGLPADGVVLA